LWDALKTAAQLNIDPIYGPNRQGDVRDSLANIDKAKALLGYEPAYTVKEGLSITWDSFNR
jgi:UDP-N-acetylglucosamine 4-epimerase